VLLLVYWATAIASKINIGHRHILPTYPVMFILAGAAAGLFRRGRRGVLGWVVGLCVMAYVAEGVWTWPNYLAYFNQVVGGPKNGYRHLVDSSLDWGQDLPGLRRWLDRNHLNDPSSATPVYLSYFGTGSPTWHGIKARRLKGFIDMDLWDNRPIFQELRGGVYCISASMLPMVLIEPRGPWSAFCEREYRFAQARLQEINSMPPDARRRRLRAEGREWDDFEVWFDALRLGRLMAALRHRDADDQIGYSILIYRLSDAEVAKAVHGEPAELVKYDAPLREVLGID
jgi:hypothetical protein